MSQHCRSTRSANALHAALNQQIAAQTDYIAALQRQLAAQQTLIDGRARRPTL